RASALCRLRVVARLAAGAGDSHGSDVPQLFLSLILDRAGSGRSAAERARSCRGLAAAGDELHRPGPRPDLCRRSERLFPRPWGRQFATDFALYANPVLRDRHRDLPVARRPAAAGGGHGVNEPPKAWRIFAALVCFAIASSLPISRSNAMPDARNPAARAVVD